MLSVERAKNRVSELDKEAKELAASLRGLEGQHIDINKRLDAAYVAAERTPTPQNQREANQIEAEARALAVSLRRKSTALEACQADLAVAQNDVQLAMKAAAVKQLEVLCAELTSMAAELEKNILRADLWERVATLAAIGDALYRQVKPAETPWRQAVFTDTRLVANRVIQRLGATIGGAIDVHKRVPHPVEVATIAEALELTRLQKEIVHLRRLHIEDITPAPVKADAVPA